MTLDPGQGPACDTMNGVIMMAGTARGLSLYHTGGCGHGEAANHLTAMTLSSSLLCTRPNTCCQCQITVAPYTASPGDHYDCVCPGPAVSAVSAVSMPRSPEQPPAVQVQVSPLSTVSPEYLLPLALYTPSISVVIVEWGLRFYW